MDFSRYDESIRKLHEEYNGYVVSADKRVTGVLRKLKKRAVELDDTMLLGFVYHAGAYVDYYITGNYDGFLKNLRLAARHILRCDDKSEMKNVYYMITIDAMNKGLLDIAHHFSVLARNVAVEAGQEDAAAIIDGMIAVLLMRMGAYEEAYGYIMKSIEGIRENPSHPMYHLNLIIAYTNEGTALLELGRTKEAAAKYADAVRYMTSYDVTIEPDTRLDLEALGLRIAMKTQDDLLVKERLDSLLRMMEDAVQILDHMIDLQQIGEVLLERGAFDDSARLISAIGRFNIPEGATSARQTCLEMKIDHYRACGDKAALSGAYEEMEKEFARAQREQRSTYVYVKELIRLADELQREQERANKEHEIIEKKANTDELCGIPNRHALNTRLEQTYERAFRAGYAMGVCLMDVDGLKAYNDTYGHAAGDECLVKIGKALEKAAKKDGMFAARYGGDEFVLIYENRTDGEITASVERIKKKLPLTVSVGVCNAVPDSKQRSWDFLARADGDLYRIKNEKKG